MNNILFSTVFLSKKMPPKTSDAVHESIIQWLKIKENLFITGAAGFNSAVVSGKKL